MKKVLAVFSSISGASGQSSQLTEAYLEARSAKGAIDVIRRDLVSDNLSHLSAQEMSAWMQTEAERSDEQKALAGISDTYINELLSADEIVLAVPMYNFGIPSVLKAWIDRIARAGITFKYTEQGPVGLVTNKKVTILAARGGMYAGTALDTQTSYLTNFFKFIGIDKVDFVYAEGLAMGEEAANQSRLQASEKIFELIENGAD